MAADVDVFMRGSAKTLRWGILGAGGIAGTFVREVLSSGGTVQAVASRSLEKAQKFVELFGSGRYGLEHGQVPGASAVNGGNKIMQAHGSYEELIANPDVDVIYIATPHSEHETWALKCLDGGKPLLIEKAVAQNAEQAQRIYAKAREKGLFCMEAMWTRFLPHQRQIKRIVEDGIIGEVVTVQADFGIRKDYDEKHRLYNPALAGGALLDLGIYPISFANFILGKPDNIIASGAAVPTGVDGNLVLIFEYNSGARALLSTTNLAFTSTCAVISGTKGRIEVANPFYRPSVFKVYLNSGEVFDYSFKTENVDLFGEDGRFGMHYEAVEVAKCIENSVIESATISHEESVSIMKQCDEIRRQLDFKFPNEV
jgi:predicted dehydrogenase